MFFVKLLLRPPYFCRPCLSRYYPSRWLWQEEYVLSLVMSGSVPDEPCSVSGLLLLRCSSADATSQVNWCYVAGHGLQCGRSAFLGRTCDVVASQQRFPSPVPSKKSDLRRQRGRPATPDGEPALPEWKTCDAIWGTSITGVEDLRHYMLYSSDFRRRSPAKNRTCGAGVADLRRQRGGGDLRRCVFPRRPRTPRSFAPTPRLPAPFPLPPPPLPPSRTPGSASETLRNTLIY